MPGIKGEDLGEGLEGTKELDTPLYNSEHTRFLRLQIQKIYKLVAHFQAQCNEKDYKVWYKF